MKIRPLQKLYEWLTGERPLTEEEVRRQLRHDFPMLEGLASGEIMRIGKKDFEDSQRTIRELRAELETVRGAHCPGCDAPGCSGASASPAQPIQHH